MGGRHFHGVALVTVGEVEASQPGSLWFPPDKLGGGLAKSRGDKIIGLDFLTFDEERQRNHRNPPSPATTILSTLPNAMKPFKSRPKARIIKVDEPDEPENGAEQPTKEAESSGEFPADPAASLFLRIQVPC